MCWKWYRRKTYFIGTVYYQSQLIPIGFHLLYVYYFVEAPICYGLILISNCIILVNFWYIFCIILLLFILIRHSYYILMLSISKHQLHIEEWQILPLFPQVPSHNYIMKSPYPSEYCISILTAFYQICLLRQ